MVWGSLVTKVFGTQPAMPLAFLIVFPVCVCVYVCVYVCVCVCVGSIVGKCPNTVPLSAGTYSFLPLFVRLQAKLF